MRLASTDKPSAAVFAFSHESTSAMERHVIGGRAALSEAGCAALLSEASCAALLSEAGCAALLADLGSVLSEAG